MFTEAYLEPSLTSLMKLFCKNSWQLVDINYFWKNAPLYIDVWLGSKYATGSLDKPC